MCFGFVQSINTNKTTMLSPQLILVFTLGVSCVLLLFSVLLKQRKKHLLVPIGNLGNANLDVEVFEAVKGMKPQHILEFGSGDGTKFLCDIAPTTSVEHNKKWAKPHANNNTMIHAELSPRDPSPVCPRHTQWYNKQKLNQGLKQAVAQYGVVDVVIVDGPTWRTGRGGSFEFLKQMQPMPKFIVFDDTHRKDEQELSAAMKKVFFFADVQRIKCKKTKKMFDVFRLHNI